MALKEFDPEGLVFSYMGKHYGPAVCKVKSENYEALMKKKRQLNGEDLDDAPEEAGDKEDQGSTLPDPRLARAEVLRKKNLVDLRDMAERFDLLVPRSTRKDPYIEAIIKAEFGEPEKSTNIVEEEVDDDPNSGTESGPDFTALANAANSGDDEDDPDSDPDEEEVDDDE